MSSALALLSAALFAVAAVLVRRGMQGATAITATLVSVLTNLVVLWALAVGTGGIRLIHPAAAATFLAAGLFAPALARFTYYEAMNLIGVARASTISNTTPIFTALLAVPMLGEDITWRLAAGTVLVVLGLVLTIRPDVTPAWRGGRRDARENSRRGPAGTDGAPAVEAVLGDGGERVAGGGIDGEHAGGERAGGGPVRGGRIGTERAAGGRISDGGIPVPSAGRPWAGALLALNTSVMASISTVLRKIGLGLLPDAAVASALTVTGSLLVLLPYALLRSGGQPFRAGRGAMTVLVVSALFTTAAFLSYFYALSSTQAVRVSPLSNTTPLFALLFLALSRQERIRAATVVGALLAVAGVLFVVTG